MRLALDEPRRLLLEALWRRGFPATLMTPTGLLPAAIVWVDIPDDPALGMLRRGFGGYLMLEMRNHHGEESPAFWVGVGRSAVLPLGALIGALEGRVWGVEGPPRPELLGGSAEAAWRALDAFAALRMRGEPGTPTPPAGAIARQVEALEALVAGAFTLAPHISGGLNTAMLGVLRSDSFAVNLTLPSRRERDLWAARFLAG